MQFGKKVLVTQLPFKTLEANFEVDHEVQRKLDPKRRFEIREYILKCIEKNEDFYFSPFIFSSRSGIKETNEGWILDPGSKIFILDGQHRAKAFLSAISNLNSKKESAEEFGNFDEAEKIQTYIDKLKNYPIAMQIYLNLSQQEERQLFTDTNTERKEAHVGLIVQYDHRDEYNELTRNLASQLEYKLEIEQKLSRLTNQSSAVTSLAIMRRCLIALFEGVLGAKNGEAYPRNCKPSDVPIISKAFFEMWIRLFPRQMENRKKYVSGLTGIQIALAYTVYQLTRNQSTTHMEAIEKLIALKKHCTWKHTDPLFTHLYDPTSGRIKNHSSITAIQKLSLIFLSKLELERK
ncbi:DNA sulfur modification protein DndB [Heyndrickxia vini]|nr:DNA sulfur modification protein DndB [Heyndrickxia vini]